jgi:uncharacterized integral membrane protein
MRENVMRKFFSSLVLILIGIVLVTFAVANRHDVTVSFDPFNSSNPSLGITGPLFVVIIAVAILGVLAGGLATWFGQRHWRRAARRHEADARQARTRLNDLRAGAPAPAGFDPQRLPAPRREAAGYQAGGRDKQGATL